MQVLACLADNSRALTSADTRKLSSQYAPYTIKKLLQVVDNWLEKCQDDADEEGLHGKVV